MRRLGYCAALAVALAWGCGGGSDRVVIENPEMTPEEQQAQEQLNWQMQQTLQRVPPPPGPAGAPGNQR